MTNSESKSEFPKAIGWTWFGSIRDGIALGAADIAIATLRSGKKVFATHGRNLTLREAEHYARESKYTPIKAETGDRYELIIADDDVQRMDLQH